MKDYEYERNYTLENHYWWFVGVRKMIRTLLQLSGEKKFEKALDVGCGTGALLDELRSESDELWGLDISSSALDYCRERGHGNLIQCDATRIPFPDNYFDLITAIGTIEHLDDDVTFVKEVSRVLKPGGLFIMCTSSFPWLWSMHDVANEHRRRYYLTDIGGIFQKENLVKIRASHLNFILFPILAPTLLLHRLFIGLESTAPRRIMPEPPAIVNKVLILVLFLEAWCMRWIHFPWGISIIGLWKKNPLD